MNHANPAVIPRGWHYPMAFHGRFAQAYAMARPADQLRVAQGIQAIINAMPIYAYRPLPTARRFHQSTKTRRWLFGGNRSSKSTSLVVDLLWSAMAIHPWRKNKPETLNLYGGPSYDHIGKVVWPKMQYYLRGIKIPPVVWANRAKGIPSIVRVPCGKGRLSEIRFGSYEQGRESFAGPEWDNVANDEQFPQDVYVEQITRAGVDRPVNFSAAITPIDPQPWLEEGLARGLGPEHEVFEMPLDENRASVGGFFPDAAIDALIADWPEEVQPTRRMGKFGAYLGAVFKSWNRATHVLAEAQERKWLMPDGVVPHNTEVICALDWGGANPFVFLWALKLGKDDYYIFDEYYWNPRLQGVRLISEHRNEIMRRSKDWRASPLRIWADHDPQDVAELSNFGLATVPAQKDRQRGVERMQTLIKPRPEIGRPRFRIAERCRNLATEMSTLHYPKGTATADPRNEPVKKDDHGPDAARYITYSEYLLDGGADYPENPAPQNEDTYVPTQADLVGGPWR